MVVLNDQKVLGFCYINGSYSLVDKEANMDNHFSLSQKRIQVLYVVIKQQK